MRPLMAAAWHEFFTPSYTGLGERAHLASPSNNLDTHIQDVLGVLKFENLRNVVLIGHRYGGAVATGVADRAPEQIAQIIYLDAFVPKDGQQHGRDTRCKLETTCCTDPDTLPVVEAHCSPTIASPPVP